ncbi:type 2 periplasmic-binding domain-containing protein [Paenibacillus cymbidii]|uniref:ABC transporter substrate-binding protein n=1 Tax=Paenibacillus cymbidii TaxID=1639034 RepID=UPI001081BB81|nr:ABC transporter substrate-binding protein [Paenibacillus cymbidii]
MKRKKWFIAGCTVILAATAVLSGCSRNTGHEGTASSSKPTGASAKPATDPNAPGDFSKKLEISWVGNLARGKIEDNNFVQKKLEEKFNVKLINKKIDINNPDQVNLMLASGDLPEATFFVNSFTKTYNDGLLRTIPKAMIQKYAPKYAKMLDDNATGWLINTVPGKPEEYTALTGIGENVAGLIMAQTYRLDWLEKLGIKPKGTLTPVGTSGGKERIFFTKEAFTMEENAKIFDAFVNGDPDGNGKKDTFAITPNNQSMYWWASTLMGAYGLGTQNSATFNFEENGKLVEATISTKYKDFLKAMFVWYKKGYIEPEFTTLNISKSWEKYATGKVGFTVAEYSGASMDNGNLGRPVGNLLTKDTSAKILITPPSIGPDGKQGAGAYLPVTTFARHFAVRKDVSDEKLIRILQMFDYINFDKEGEVLTRYGEVNTHFKWQGEPYRSAAIFNDGVTNEGQYGFGYYTHQLNTKSIMTYFTSAETMKLVNDYFFHPDYGLKQIIRPYRFDYFNETKYADLKNKYGAKLDTLTNEMTFKAIIGEVNIDQAWDAYVKNWQDSGGAELLAELAKSPKVADLLKK